MRELLLWSKIVNHPSKYHIVESIDPYREKKGELICFDDVEY